MMYNAGQSSDLDELLGISIAEFDIPDDVYARAVSRYEGLADWLAAYWPDDNTGGVIYPQGSIRLGTMVAPIHPGTDYDIDLVCRRDLVRESTTQQGLKQDVGRGLDAYLATGPDGDPSKAEGKRCWTLDYLNEPFHMDVLPAIPNPASRPNGLLLTDRELRLWQASNPKDYAEWFHGRMHPELLSLKEAVAKRMDVEEAPPSQLKTTLQRSVQALKRHRDIYFADSSEGGPASIILTTLAAKSYDGGGALFEVLASVTSKMPEQVERRAGDYWIANPVQPDENFADRWKGRPDSAKQFFDWMEVAQADFERFGREPGVDRLIESMARSFGEEPARRAGQRFGARLNDKRTSGRLQVSAAGLLGSSSGQRVPDHTFHGDAPKRS